MNVFKVPDSLENKYHGAGYALAATTGGQLVDIRYLAELVDPIPDTEQKIAALIQSDALAPVVRELQCLGNVHFGMCGGWEFTEL